MFKVWPSYIVFTAAAMLLAACTVKEDRGECPCWTDVVAESINPARTVQPHECLTMVFVNNEGWSMQDRIMPADIDPETSIRTYELPRRWTDIAAIAGDRDVVVDGSRYVPMDRMASYPELFLYNEYRSLFHESVVIVTEPHKQFCRLSVTVTPELNPERGTLMLHVSGRAVGIDIFSTEPVAGDFVTEASVDAAGRAELILPRQLQGDRLVVSVYDGTEVIASSLVSEHLTKAGYDWSKTDLDDASLFIDRVFVDGNIIINPWRRGAEGDYEI